MNDLSQEEKAAVFLGSLAPAVMESVLAKLAPERRTKLRPLVQGAPPAVEDLARVLHELERMLANNAPSTPSNTPPVSAAQVANTYGVGTAKQDTHEAAEAGDNPAVALSSMEPDELATALRGENPRTVCLILNSMPVEQAAQIFKRLPGESRREVSVHFAAAASPSPEVVRRIVQAVVRKSRQLKEKPPEPGPEVRYQNMAKMMRLLEKPERKDVLTALEEHDPTAAAAVKDLLYCFDDLLKIENRSIQRLLGELDTKNLAVALKGAEQAIKEKILTNMSQRAQQTLNEEVELGANATAAQVQQAQKVIVDAIQKLDQAGELVMTQD